MTQTISPPPKLPAAQKLTLHNVTWDGYIKMLDALGENCSARLTYDRGTLEIMVPLEAHEHPNRLIEALIGVLTEELNLPLKSIGSTTLNRPDLKRGSEPDSCFYIQNEPLVRGRTTDLNQDPPPDLVIEVNITHTDIDKPELYATLGIPELWQYNGQTLRIYQLQQGQYQEVERSPTFSQVPKATFYKFLAQSQTQGMTSAKKALRTWMQQNQLS